MVSARREGRREGFECQKRALGFDLEEDNQDGLEKGRKDPFVKLVVLGNKRR